MVNSYTHYFALEGFGYKFSGPCKWQDLMLLQQGRSISLTCNHANSQEPAFQIHALPVKDKTTSQVPIMFIYAFTHIRLQGLSQAIIETSSLFGTREFATL